MLAGFVVISYLFDFFDLVVKICGVNVPPRSAPWISPAQAGSSGSIALRRRRRDGVLRNPLGCLAKLRCQNPAWMPDFGTRKGLKRYPFLPQAKKIQA
jgi:hypothetical protein